MSTTRDTFNEIAPSWYNYRHWTIFRAELEELAKRWQKGRLLNIGCGHGADFLPFAQGFELHGMDFSPEMLKLAQKYAVKFKFRADLVEADASNLPYKVESFDWVIAVATYHHIEKSEDRLKAMEELRRVLKPGGEAFITVWNRWQPRFWLKKKQLMVPWRTKDKTLYRFYYLFTYGELERLVKKTGFTVLKSFPERGYHFPLKVFSKNICLLVKKSG
jgi:tRNA (uracil-5-)-methyltransferase TRM9